jgi:hypothetical protein
MTEERVPVLPITCPIYHGRDRCNGVLNYKGTFHTDMGTANGVDLNYFTEYFVCADCKTEVQRTYIWMVTPR